MKMTNITAGLSPPDQKTSVDQEIAALREKVDRLVERRVPPALSDVAHNATATASEVWDSSSSIIRRHPAATVGVAVLSGFALAMFLRR
jgi:ElaB/YqjD/DUF883 family membrane-anchored ribosome-binding protein